MKNLLLCSLLLFSTTASAQWVSLEYQGFYQRLKQVNDGHYPLVEIAFFVPNDGKCKLKSGNLATEKEEFPLTITKDQRVYLPYDKRLKSDRARINLDVEGDTSLCTIAMQVRAKTTKANYSAAELSETVDQMNALLNKLQGFPMRYFTDDIKGLNFEFNSEEVTVKMDGVSSSVSESYKIPASKIAEVEQLSFDLKPRIISPWIEK